MRSLLHLLGLKLFRGAGTVYPRDTPIILLPKQILRQAPSSVPVPCQPPTALPTCLYSSLKRAFPRSVSSKGAACLPPAGETETWTKSPPASQQAPGLRCSVAPRAQNQVQPQRLPDVAPWGVRESSCLEASHLPSTCSCGRGCACASVCVAECSTCACRCVWREGGRGAWCLPLHRPVSSPISCPLLLCIERPVQRSSL